MAHQLKRLQTRHFKIMDLLLLGMKQCDIADEMGLSKYGVSIIVRSPVFQDRLARRRTEHDARLDEAEATRLLTARDVLEAEATGAARKQIALLESPSERVAQISAMDILDRAGCPKTSRSEDRHVQATIVLDENALARIQKANRECFGEEMDMGMLMGNDATGDESS